MLSAALTSFLTGVTEPLEFAFMFVAWPLYVIHAVLTGTSLALVNALGIKDGFGFSAGLFDYVLNWNIATKPLWLILIGARVRRRLLLPVPVRDPQVEPADPGPRGRRRGVGGRGRHERLSVLISAGRVVTPARVFAPGWVLVDGDRIAEVGPGDAAARAGRRSCPTRPSCRASWTPTCTAAAGASFDGGSRRRRPRPSRAPTSRTARRR